MSGPLKPRTDLLPPGALLEVARVLALGAEIHGERGWTTRAFGQDYGALLRHALAWWRGEDRDPHSGCSHLAHVAARALILLERVPSAPAALDDRPAARPTGFVQVSGAPITAADQRRIVDRLFGRRR